MRHVEPWVIHVCIAEGHGIGNLEPRCFILRDLFHDTKFSGAVGLLIDARYANQNTANGMFNNTNHTKPT